MPSASSPNVLILAANGASAESWAKTLRPVSREVWCGEAPDSTDARVDLILSDSADSIATTAGSHAQPVGTILVGQADEDVVDLILPADTTPRELQLACRLLGQIVALRRAGREAAGQRAALADLAMRDPLTGVANRRAWDQQLAAALAASDSAPLAVALVDLDHFKSVNDVHGLPIGDRVLCEAAEALRQELRQDDLVARLGGDEFALLLRRVEPESAKSAVERARAAVARRLDEKQLPPVTASAGLVFSASGDEVTAEGMIAAADRAMRIAKQAGRDRTVTR